MTVLSSLSRWHKVSFHHSSNSYQLLENHSRSNSTDRLKKSFVEFCKECVPPFCYLSPFLFNGHLQTAWTQIDTKDVPVYYKRKIFDSDHAAYSGQFSVDFVVPAYVVKHSYHQMKENAELPARTTFFEAKEEADYISVKDSRPVLIMLHGMAGGSDETYIRQALAPLVTHEEGWEACVVNSRGCAGSTLTTGFLYNALSTWDFRQVVRWLTDQFPNRPLFGIGFSIGAVILTNYLAEEGSNCALKAAVMVSNPWKLDFASQALQQSWVGSEIYSKILGYNMKNIVQRNIDIITQTHEIDRDSVEKIKYVQDFDREVQCPTWGYPTEDAYYRDASCVDSMLAIRIPFLAIQAQDDPISTKHAIPTAEFNKTPFGVLCVTPGGGHLGWFEAGGERWFVKPITKFFTRMAEEVDLDESMKLNRDLDIEPLVNGKVSKERLSLFNPLRLPPRKLGEKAKL